MARAYHVWTKGLSKEDPRIQNLQAKRKITIEQRYPDGLKSWNKGMKMPADVKTKQSESAKRRWQRERDKIIEAQTRGKLKSPLFKATHRGYGKKMWATSESRAKMLLGLSHARKQSTKIEILAQQSLASRGIPFLANMPVENLCTPDLVLTDRKVVIFCDGCFWHACPICGYNHPRSRSRYGLDKRNTAILRSRGWTVLRFWEHDFKAESDIVGIAIDNLEAGQTTLDNALTVLLR